MSALRAACGVALAGALLAWAGCAGELNERAPARFPKSANRCVPRQTISSWRPIDAYRLKLFADREYVVELLTRCGSLTSTEGVAFNSRDNQVCDYRGDTLQTDRESCSIAAIRTVEEYEQMNRPQP